jgi:hypothetical protein
VGRDGAKNSEIWPEQFTQDANATPPDPEQVAQQLKPAGLGPEAVLADAGHALEKVGHAVKAEQLSAKVLA